MRRLAVALVVLAATLTFVTVTSARPMATAPVAPITDAVTMGTCSNPSTSPGGTVVVWENALYDYSDGNDKWWSMCHSNAGFGWPDLRQNLFPPNSNCHSGNPINGTWNDCISHVEVWLASSLWRLCIYRDLTYHNLSYWVQGPADNVSWNISPNDDATSIRLMNDGTC